MLGAGYPMYPRAGDWHRSCPACRLATHHSSVPPVESLIPERHTLELMALPGGNGGKALGSSWDRGRLHWGQWLCRAGWYWNVAIPRALLSAAKPWLYLAQVRPQLGDIGSPCPPAAPPHSVLPQRLAAAPPGLSSHPTAQPHFSGFELILSTPLAAGCQLSILLPPPSPPPSPPAAGKHWPQLQDRLAASCPAAPGTGAWSSTQNQSSNKERAATLQTPTGWGAPSDAGEPSFQQRWENVPLGPSWLHDAGCWWLPMLRMRSKWKLLTCAGQEGTVEPPWHWAQACRASSPATSQPLAGSAA